MNGTEVFELTINPNPSSIASGVVQDGNVVLNGAVINADSFYWSFTDTSGQSIHSDVTELTPTLPLSDFPAMEPGAVFYAILNAVNQCNSIGYRVVLTVPASTQTCTIDATNDIKNYYAQIGAFIGGQVFQELTPLQQDLFLSARSFFDVVAQQPGPYIAGTRNEEMFDSLVPIIANTHKVLLSMDAETPENQRSAMIKLYQLLVRMFLSIVQCQDDQNYQVPPISSLFNLIYGHLDPNSPDSFTAHGINIDPDGGFASSVLTSREFRAEGTGSWSKINDVYYYLTQGGGGGGFLLATGPPASPSQLKTADGKGAESATLAAAPAPTTETPPKKTTKKTIKKK
jgi:hypothetical protein